jgi:hypothetical protein
MDRSSKKEALTPQQVAMRAREFQPQGRVVQGMGDEPSRQSASVPRANPQRSPSQSSASGSRANPRSSPVGSSPILEHTRRTIREAQAFRTAAGVVLLDLEAWVNEG